MRGGFNFAPGTFDVSGKPPAYFLDNGPFANAGLDPLIFTNPVNEFLPQGRATNTYALQDNATYTRGKHVISFGYQSQWIGTTPYNYGGTVPYYGLGESSNSPYGFQTGAIPGANATFTQTGNDLLAALAGLVADDQQVFVDNAGTGENDRLLLGIAAEAFAEVDPPSIAEIGDWLTRAGVEGVEIALHRCEKARCFAIGPVNHGAIRPVAGDAGIERPQQLSGDAIERDGLVAGRQAIENAADEYGLSLRIAVAIGGVVSPGDGESFHIGAGDLLEIGVADARGSAAVSGPIVVGGGED